MKELFAALMGVWSSASIACMYLFYAQIYHIPRAFTSSVIMRIITPCFFGVFAFFLYISIIEQIHPDVILWQRCLGASCLTIAYFFILSVCGGTLLNFVTRRTNVPLYMLVVACLFICIFVIVTLVFKKPPQKKKRKRRRRIQV